MLTVPGTVAALNTMFGEAPAAHPPSILITAATMVLVFMAAQREKFSFGLGHKDTALETAIGSMIAPIDRAFRLLGAPLRK